MGWVNISKNSGLPSGFTLDNSGQTVFGESGDTLVQAQTKRDDYFTANPQFLAQYDQDNLRLIRLVYTDATVDKFQFNNRLNSAWVNTFGQEVASVDLSMHSVTELDDVTVAGAGIIPDATTNAKTAALITDDVTNKTANFTINAASESDHAGKTTVYSAAVDGVCRLGDLTDDTLWASSKLYTIRTVVNPLTINTGSGRLFDNGTTSLTLKPGESMMLQGAVVGGSRVFVKKLDSIHGGQSRSYSFPYINNTPVQTTDQDTGVNATSLPVNTDVIVTILFTVTASSTQYAIPVTVDNALVLMSAGIRQLRSAEPVTGGGDVAFAAWLDGTSGTYHYSLDVDGGGKVLNSVSVVVRTLD